MEAETLGHTSAHRSVCRVADSLAEVDVETLGDTVSDAHALVKSLADTVAEVEVETPGETRGDAQALLDTVAALVSEVEGETLWRHTGRCVGTGRDAR